ncbi:hypothetical protein TWF730_001566 [Orbilia blumenaviensis]|uniref:Uncharacterized protein n=1 Tax=Orbilia blumenaviensis TaxID=1796055 RepID=A0AAV9UK65_9PEZI
MQLKSYLLPLLSVASTLTATPIASPDKASLESRSAAGCFEITQFRNSGSPHSISATVSFDVVDRSTNAAATCRAILSIQPSIVTTQFPTYCNDTTVAFGFQYNPPFPGYWLSIAHIYNNNNTVDAGAVWAGRDIRRYDNPSGNPNGDYDYLNYPAEFSVAYNRHVQQLPISTAAAPVPTP